MDFLEFFLILIFIALLFVIFKNDLVNSDEQFNLFNNELTLNTGLKQGLWYPFGPSNYYNYWGFQPYKGLWGHINPWWYYPYPYPTPIDYNSCPSKQSQLK